MFEKRNIRRQLAEANSQALRYSDKLRYSFIDNFKIIQDPNITFVSHGSMSSPANSMDDLYGEYFFKRLNKEYRNHYNKTVSTSTTQFVLSTDKNKYDAFLRDKKQFENACLSAKQYIDLLPSRFILDQDAANYEAKLKRDYSSNLIHYETICQILSQFKIICLN